VDILHNPVEKRLKTALEDEIILVEWEVILHRKSDRWTPRVPSHGSMSMGIQCTAEKGNNDVHPMFSYIIYKILYKHNIPPFFGNTTEDDWKKII